MSANEQFADHWLRLLERDYHRYGLSLGDALLSAYSPDPAPVERFFADLRAVLAELSRLREANAWLEAECTALNQRIVCGCEDRPGDVCMVHWPAKKALEARLDAVLRLCDEADRPPPRGPLPASRAVSTKSIRAALSPSGEPTRGIHELIVHRSQLPPCRWCGHGPDVHDDTRLPNGDGDAGCSMPGCHHCTGYASAASLADPTQGDPK